MSERMNRREALRRGGVFAAAASLPVALASCGDDGESTKSASAGGSGTSETIKIGFIALTDCASIVMAESLGYFKDRGLNVELVKQASWPATRDALINGDIHAAHCLSSMPFSVAAGVGGKAGNTALKIAMILNNNGQAITLEKGLASAGYGDLTKAKTALNGGKGKTLAMTFPGGTHDTWLRYWLMAAGIPMDAAKIIPIPPPQMVANMKVGNMDGYSVGEPWNAVAVDTGIGFTAITSQDIWEHHPEKALVVNETFQSSRTEDLKAVMGAILQASKFIDTPGNVTKVAETIGTPAFVKAKPAAIEGRLGGKYDLGAGLGTKDFGDTSMKFFRDGETNFPRKSYGYWFLAQYQRFGLVKSAPDYEGITSSIVLTDLYKDVAKAEGITVPDDDMAPFTVKLDNTTFDPAKVDKEAARS
jgi:nitrate/nitrite transport system substrate-binding protein